MCDSLHWCSHARTHTLMELYARLHCAQMTRAHTHTTHTHALLCTASDKASDSDSEAGDGYQDPPFVPSAAEVYGRRKRPSAATARAATAAALGLGGGDAPATSGPGDHGLLQAFSASASASITSQGIVGLDSTDSSGTDSDGWDEGDIWAGGDSWDEGGSSALSSASEFFEVGEG